VKRGDVVVVVLPGGLGKPRPAVIVQSDRYLETKGVTVVPLTSDAQDANLLRVTILPDATNGLREMSQAMTDKLTTVSREKIGQIVGVLDDRSLKSLNVQLALFLGIV
jgi:mRNA interferase MazF